MGVGRPAQMGALGTSLSLSVAIDSPAKAKLDRTSAVLFGVHSMILLFSVISQYFKDCLCINIFLHCRQKEPFVCQGPLNNQHPKMDFFLKEISSSVCFVIENSDYVPLFHLAFPQCASVPCYGLCEKRRRRAAVVGSSQSIEVSVIMEG